MSRWCAMVHIVLAMSARLSFTRLERPWQVDVWAAGCILYQLLFNKHPFRKANIIVDNWTIPKGRSQSEPLITLLCECLQVASPHT